MLHNKTTIMFKVRRDIIYKNINQQVKSEIESLTLDDLKVILHTLAETSRSSLAARDIDIFKMRYGIDYDVEYTLREIAEKYNRTTQNSVYTINKVKNMIVRYIRYRLSDNSPTNKSLDVSLPKLYTNVNKKDQGNYYLKHLLALGREEITSKEHIAKELASRDMVISKLYGMLDLALCSINSQTGDGTRSNIKNELSTMELDVYLKDSI